MVVAGTGATDVVVAAGTGADEAAADDADAVTSAADAVLAAGDAGGVGGAGVVDGGDGGSRAGGLSLPGCSQPAVINQSAVAWLTAVARADVADDAVSYQLLPVTLDQRRYRGSASHPPTSHCYYNRRWH